MQKEVKIWQAIILILLFSSVSFGAGVYYGVQRTIREGVNLMYGFMDRQKINITIDKDMLATAIFQYKERVGGCLFLEDGLGKNMSVLR